MKFRFRLQHFSNLILDNTAVLHKSAMSQLDKHASVDYATDCNSKVDDGDVKEAVVLALRWVGF